MTDEKIKPELLYCSFCGKSQEEIALLIANSSSITKVNICNECVGLCNNIIADWVKKRTKKGDQTMREVNIGTKKYSKVVCLDEPDEGGACCKYEIWSVGDAQTVSGTIFGVIDFQDGPVLKAGINGCHQEDLLVIVIDRLQHFQQGDFACEENAMALTHCEDALDWLRSRTNTRVERGVEGTNQV